MSATRVARNPSLLDSDLQWLAAQAPQFHNQPEPSMYYFSKYSDDSSSETDNDASGSEVDPDDDPYHPYNVDEPQKKWVSNGQFVYDADQLQTDILAPEHEHVIMNDAPFMPKAEEKDLRPLLQMPTVDFSLQSSPFLQSYSLDQHGYPQHSQLQLPQVVSPLDISQPLPTIHDEPSSVSASRANARPARTPATRSSARAKATNKGLSEDVDASDSDFLAESDADDSEDEYVDPRVSSRRRRTTRRGASGQARHKNRLSASPYPSSTRSTSASSSASARSRPGSRNEQIFDRPPPRRGEGFSKEGPTAWHCDYCGHHQTNKRAPDMVRHIMSHFRAQMQAQWVCCGVPKHEAQEYGVDPTRNPWVFKGQVLVGGCHEGFSRMDALKRHWNNPNVQCNGSVQWSRPGDE